MINDRKFEVSVPEVTTKRRKRQEAEVRTDMTLARNSFSSSRDSGRGRPTEPAGGVKGSESEKKGKGKARNRKLVAKKGRRKSYQV